MLLLLLPTLARKSHPFLWKGFSDSHQIPNKITKLWHRSISRKSLSMLEFGKPLRVLELIEDELEEKKLGKNQILLKVLMSAINPSDLSIIEGRYPLKPRLPAVPGNDFVAEVVQMGEFVRGFQIGQRVVALDPCLGTWTTHMIVDKQQVYPIIDALDLVTACLMTMNPCAAYRMLRDFIKIRPGDLVIQNAANSSVGQCVHQLCKMNGVKSVGVIRDRPDSQIIKQHLKRLGASEIFTEQEMEEETTIDLFKEHFPLPILALNCVGGKSAELISRHLDRNGVMVTYGNLSSQPFRAFTGPLIFKQNRCVGFWMTQWNLQNHQSPERFQMIDNLSQILIQNNLKLPPTDLIPLEEFRSAKEAFTPGVSLGKKYVLDMTYIHNNNNNKDENHE